jgi:hypothetical protein
MADAGWYADPHGRHEQRYFDGAQWTDHVADAGVASVDRVDAVGGATHTTVESAAVSAQAQTSGAYSMTASGPAPAPHGRRVGKTRNPWGVWLTSLVTLGIYGLYWYYKVNDETREYSPNVDVDPTVSLLALIFGAFTCYVATIVTLLNTGGRISRCQQEAGASDRCSGGLGLLFGLLLGTHVVYYQSQLNKVWDRYGNPPEGSTV